jgi:uncharacterized integral membrane protein
MRRAIFLLFIIATAALGVDFAYRNASMIAINFLAGMQWHGPLALALLIVFAVGVVAGIAASLGIVLRAQKDLNRTRRDLRESEIEAHRLRQLPIRDML